MKVEIDFKTNMRDLVESFLFCTNKLDEVDNYIDNDNNLIEKGNKLIYKNLVDTENPHMQLLNQVQMRVKIFNISRRCLQEFARHRFGNEMTVRSTRYSLHDISKDEDILLDWDKLCDPLKFKETVAKYYYIPDFNEAIYFKTHSKNGVKIGYNWWYYDRYEELKIIKKLKLNGAKNDELKDYINENMYTNINTVMSATALINMLRKRLDKSAFYEFRDLAKAIYKAIPDKWKFLFNVYKYEKVDYKYLLDKINDIEEDIKNKEYFCYNELKDDVKHFFEELKPFLEKNLVEKIYLTKDL